MHPEYRDVFRSDVGEKVLRRIDYGFHSQAMLHLYEGTDIRNF